MGEVNWIKTDSKSCKDCSIEIDKRFQTLIRSVTTLQFCPEVYMKLFIFALRLQMKVKNDHRSKFSNLSNWKEEA